MLGSLLQAGGVAQTCIAGLVRLGPAEHSIRCVGWDQSGEGCRESSAARLRHGMRLQVEASRQSGPSSNSVHEPCSRAAAQHAATSSQRNTTQRHRPGLRTCQAGRQGARRRQAWRTAARSTWGSAGGSTRCTATPVRLSGAGGPGAHLQPRALRAAECCTDGALQAHAYTLFGSQATV